MEKAVLIRQLKQQDNHTFVIEWSDGNRQHIRLSKLQERCPCAGCLDETTGKRRLSASQVDEHVRATKIVNVGRYALRVFFTSGCSMGIYHFDLLRRLDS